MEDVDSSSKKRKRNRNPNWDDAEKALLRACLKDHLDKIENKCCDTKTNNIKKIAWQKVFERFNELNTKQRTLAEIKQQWRTLRIDTKKSHTSFIKPHSQTGGEPPTSGRKMQNINEELKVTSNNRKEGDTALTFLREEHELKMEHMLKTDERAQEEHVLRIKQLKLQNELLEKKLSEYNE